MFWHSAIWSFRALAVEGAAAAGGGVVVPDAGGLAVGACAPPPEIAPDPLFVSSPPPDEQAATAKAIPTNPIIVSFFMATVLLEAAPWRFRPAGAGCVPHIDVLPPPSHPRDVTHLSTSQVPCDRPQRRVRPRCSFHEPRKAAPRTDIAGLDGRPPAPRIRRLTLAGAELFRIANVTPNETDIAKLIAFAREFD
jgi:hypothetical protein